MRENLPSMGPAADDNRPRLRVEGVEQLHSISTKHGAPNGRVEKPAPFFYTDRHPKETPPAAQNRPEPPVAAEKTRATNDAPPPPPPTPPALPASPAAVLLKAYAGRRETEVAAQATAGTSARANARPAGRPRVLDAHKMGQICGLLAAGMSRRQAAHVVACNPNTITNELRRNEKFADDIQRAEAHAELVPLKCLYNAATKNWRAAAWLLEKLDRKKRGKNKKPAMTLEESMLEAQEALRALGP